MAYVVKRKKQQTFDFRIDGSKKMYHIPMLSSLPISVLSKAKALQGIEDETERADALFDFFAEIFRDEAAEVFDILSPEDFSPLFEAYVEASNTSAASAGE